MRRGTRKLEQMDTVLNSIIYLIERKGPVDIDMILMYLYLIEERAILAYGHYLLGLRFMCGKEYPLNLDMYLELTSGNTMFDGDLQFLSPYLGKNRIYSEAKFNEDNFSVSDTNLMDKLISELPETTRELKDWFKKDCLFKRTVDAITYDNPLYVELSMKDIIKEEVEGDWFLFKQQRFEEYCQLFGTL